MSFSSYRKSPDWHRFLNYATHPSAVNKYDTSLILKQTPLALALQLPTARKMLGVFPAYIFFPVIWVQSTT